LYFYSFFLSFFNFYFIFAWFPFLLFL